MLGSLAITEESVLPKTSRLWASGTFEVTFTLYSLKSIGVMPRLSKVSKRTSSDALARLCFRYGATVLNAIEEGKTSVRSDSLKARLIAYYTNLDGEWSREKEKADWKGHDLASLKYDALRLLIKVSAQELAFANKNWHIEIAEITWALQHQAYNVALDLCEGAILLTLEQEEFGFLFQILGYEKEIIDSLPESEEIDVLKARNRIMRHDCLALQQEIASCSDLIYMHLEPIKSAWVKDEIVSEAMINSFTQAMSKFDPLSLKAVSAKVDYMSCLILLNLLKGKTSDAVEAAQMLASIYREHEWYGSKFPSRKISQYRAICTLYIQSGKLKEAKKILEYFQGDDFPAGKIKNQADFSWVECTLSLAYQTIDMGLLSAVITRLDELGHSFLADLGEKEWITIHWLIMATQLKSFDWRGAYEMGKNLIGRKAKMKRNILVNVRIAMFACEVMLFPKDDQRLDSSYSATTKFLDRSKQEFPESLGVIRAIFKIWSQFDQNKLIETTSHDAINGGAHSPMYATFSGKGGYFDFRLIVNRIEESLNRINNNTN